ncbi:alpha/beta fold hydrolase [Streptomyces monticola]|uniref:Alpha/beta fold hydrolase n=1 Tax=Streptomyces monticola TaxID=2666263 RepID=A0ABW2JYQ7_9ACTN
MSMEAQNLVEQTILDIWSSALGGADVTPADDFFAVGGDSLLALVTVEQINQRLGWELNMGDMLRHRTVANLVAHKTLPQAANPHRVLVRMSNRGSRTPLVFVHPVTGLLFGYTKLVRHLGEDRACHGIQSPALTDSAAPAADTVRAIAESYVDLIEDELGEDDFHLAGWSAGAVIALEVARLATERDLGVRRLVVLDGYIWDEPPIDTDDAALLAEFRADLLTQVSPDAPDATVGGPDARTDAVYRELSTALFGSAVESGTEFVARLHSAYRTNVRALTAYRPEPADVDALLLHTAQNYTRDTWIDVLGNPAVEVLDGDHYGLLRGPEAEKIAARIAAFVGEE